MKKKGFTLIELLVVMIIIAVLLAFALPKLFSRSGSEIVDEKPAAIEQPLQLDKEDRKL